ncbi:hypothetical protein N7481_007039 [Penicillium waksmanii]|uniref:uncharacterized protein n=1 Tax=Penicillium waksmanii TaxID=69791 RepID=UPI0025480E3F|nr:uncharacterized protein N7481_007039 [Penicillium waksmanii]KAJ5979741.1 hypothetical protein N7481_007039 [Penicillium waksmanii]
MTGCIGQLIEGLVSGSATGLVPLLALPVSVHSHEGLDVLPGENVEDEEGDLACTKRSRKSALPQSHSSKAARIDHHDMHEVLQLGDFSRVRSLSNMPSEIHCRIFAFLDDVMDVLHFSLSSRYFWAVGLLRIEEHIVRSLAPWAGEPIICIDDRCGPSKYPPGLLTPEQEAEVRELNQVFDLNSFSIKNSYKRVGGPSLSQNLQKSFLEYESHYPMPEVDRVEIMMGLKPEILEFFPRDQTWILRNLTTKEFVRGEAIALRCEFMHGPQIDVLDFAEILVSRISWSDAIEKIG